MTPDRKPGIFHGRNARTLTIVTAAFGGLMLLAPGGRADATGNQAAPVSILTPDSTRSPTPASGQPTPRIETVTQTATVTATKPATPTRNELIKRDKDFIQRRLSLPGSTQQRLRSQTEGCVLPTYPNELEIDHEVISEKRYIFGLRDNCLDGVYFHWLNSTLLRGAINPITNRLRFVDIGDVAKSEIEETLRITVSPVNKDQIALSGLSQNRSRFVLANSKDGWRTENVSELPSWPGTEVYDISFSSDGKYILAKSNHGFGEIDEPVHNYQLIDSASQKRISLAPSKAKLLTSLQRQADGKYIGYGETEFTETYPHDKYAVFIFDPERKSWNIEYKQFPKDVDHHDGLYLLTQYRDGDGKIKLLYHDQSGIYNHTSLRSTLLFVNAQDNRIEKEVELGTNDLGGYNFISSAMRDNKNNWYILFYDIRTSFSMITFNESEPGNQVSLRQVPSAGLPNSAYNDFTGLIEDQGKTYLAAYFAVPLATNKMFSKDVTDGVSTKPWTSAEPFQIGTPTPPATASATRTAEPTPPNTASATTTSSATATIVEQQSGGGSSGGSEPVRVEPSRTPNPTAAPTARPVFTARAENTATAINTSSATVVRVTETSTPPTVIAFIQPIVPAEIPSQPEAPVSPAPEQPVQNAEPTLSDTIDRLTHDEYGKINLQDLDDVIRVLARVYNLGEEQLTPQELIDFDAAIKTELAEPGSPVDPEARNERIDRITDWQLQIRRQLLEEAVS